jgi:hypothetical protein
LTGKTSNPPTSDSEELRWYGYAFEIIDRQGFGYGDAYGRLQIPVQLLEMMGAVSKQYSQNLVHTDLAAIVRNHERSATQAVSPLGDSSLRPTIVLSFASLNPTIISSPTDDRHGPDSAGGQVCGCRRVGRDVVVLEPNTLR